MAISADRFRFYRAMAVLVAASPCALAISTPSAVLSGVARAARGGVLVKGGGPLDILGKFRAIAFDKTGTLTEGKPHMTDVVPAPGVSERDLLAVVLMDTPRSAAQGVIAHLRTLGITRMVMMSGDNRRVAEAVAREVGLD